MPRGRRWARESKLAKRNQFHPRRDDVDPVFDELVAELRKRKRAIGHGRVFCEMDVDQGGQVIAFTVSTDRLTNEDVRRILAEPPKGPR